MAMGYDNYLEDQYKVPILAKILHSLPHLNITFHRTNNTFRPTDEIYLEVRRWKINRKQKSSSKTCVQFSFFAESWHFGINSGCSPHHLTVLSSALLDVEMLRPKTSPRTLNHKLEGYFVYRDCSLLCRNWTW
jgi:hypothetical protein